MEVMRRPRRRAPSDGEKKTTKLNLVLKPSTVAKADALAGLYRLSINELVARLIESAAEKNSAELADYEKITKQAEQNLFAGID